MPISLSQFQFAQIISDLLDCLKIDEWRNIDDDSSNIAANQVDCCRGIPKFTH
jgi:hypothetical protein